MVTWQNKETCTVLGRKELSGLEELPDVWVVESLLLVEDG